MQKDKNKWLLLNISLLQQEEDQPTLAFQEQNNFLLLQMIFFGDNKAQVKLLLLVHLILLYKQLVSCNNLE
jgi:hypothetical protein